MNQTNTAKTSMSKFEKMFWITIVILAFIWITLQVMAYFNAGKESIFFSNNEPVLTTSVKTIFEIIDDNNSIRHNLENFKTIEMLSQNLNDNILSLNGSIDQKVDEAFAPVYTNVDSFLDFHYSVVGEYTELIGAATSKVGSIIKKKLFGPTFNTQLQEVNKYVNQEYITALHDHYEQIDSHATKDINKTLNMVIFTKLNKDIEQRLSVQAIKLGSVVGAAAAIKIVGAVSAKIIAKTATKLAAKSAIKTSAKMAASGTAATAGLACGPLAFICAPVAGGVAWFGTDALIVSVDEYMNRDEFKQEILQMIDKEKKAIKDQLQTTYTNQFKEDSALKQKNLKETVIKKTVEKQITIKEMIFK
jgi:hypothetical protein